SCIRRMHMFKNSRVQMIAMLVIGSLLGFVAASGKLDAFRKANAAPPPSSVAERENGAELVQVRLQKNEAAAATCCSEGATKGQLVAMADPNPLPDASQVTAPLATQVAPLALAQAGEQRAIVFEVMLPADAILEIDGDRTSETGEARTFQTPPLKVGS